MAGPFLLSEEPDGASCRLIEDGRLLWRAPWKFGHCRWNLGAWHQGGALYIDTDQGLARVNPDTGKIVWVWPDAVELLSVRLYPDGLLYAEFQYGPADHLWAGLAEAARAHYHWADDHFSTRIIPYKASYFGSTWRGKRYLKDGTVSIWERVNGKWSFIFDYPCQGQSPAELDALYAGYQLSPRMRRLLTIDSTATVYRDCNGKLVRSERIVGDWTSSAGQDVNIRWGEGADEFTLEVFPRPGQPEPKLEYKAHWKSDSEFSYQAQGSTYQGRYDADTGTIVVKNTSDKSSATWERR